MRDSLLCFVGHMLGRNRGYVTTQGQILSDLFAQAGYRVTSASQRISQLARLLDVIATIIRQAFTIDILIIEVYGGRSFMLEDIASWIGRRLNRGVILWLHGGALPDFMARHQRWSRRVLERADALVTPSAFLARTLSEYGFQASIIPNVIDLDRYQYKPRKQLTPRLFWMRQFHSIWNPLMAVRTLAHLRSDLPEATLVMAGPDKGQQLDVMRTASEMGLASAVRFSGFLDMDGKLREANNADIFLNTNRIDNMPVAILEACAMGLPVVSTNVGGIPDLLKDKQNALLVPDDDHEAMAMAVRSLIEGPSLASRLSQNGRRLAERSSWDSVRPLWEELFTKLQRSRQGAN